MKVELLRRVSVSGWVSMNCSMASGELMGEAGELGTSVHGGDASVVMGWSILDWRRKWCPSAARYFL